MQRSTRQRSCLLESSGETTARRAAPSRCRTCAACSSSPGCLCTASRSSRSRHLQASTGLTRGRRALCAACSPSGALLTRQGADQSPVLPCGGGTAQGAPGCEQDACIRLHLTQGHPHGCVPRCVSVDRIAACSVRSCAAGTPEDLNQTARKDEQVCVAAPPAFARSRRALTNANACRASGMAAQQHICSPACVA